MNNYWGISLMATILKLVCVILSTRILREAEKRDLYSRSQAGFWTQEECVTQVACLTEIIQRRRLEGKPTYVVFVDLHNAYNTVPHEALFVKLFRFGIRGCCLTFIKALYWSSTIRVGVGRGKMALFSDLCRLLYGVRQGCPLSPTLFIIFINDLASLMSDCGELVPVGTKHNWQNSDVTIGCALFADNAAGIYPSIAKAKVFCDHFTTWVEANEMGVGISKCGLMEFLPIPANGETPATPLTPGEVITGLELEGKPLPVVDEYMYLGVIMMTPGLSLKDMVQHRLKLGCATVAAVMPFLRSPVIPMAMKVATVRTLVGPRLLFGAELYGMNRELT